jgi:hypothetical protein
VPRRIFAHPQNGVPGHFDNPNGQRLQGVYNLVAYVYGPEEDVPAGRTTLRELRVLHGNPTQQSLVVPFTGAKFTFGPDLLNQIRDTDIVQIEFASMPPKVKSPPRAGSLERVRTGSGPAGDP